MYKKQIFKVPKPECVTNKAFTLIEMVVSITVFMIILAYAFSSFQSVTRANAVATEAQKSYRDIRHVLDSLAKDIRANTPDFSCITPRLGQAAAIDLTVASGIADIGCSEPQILDGRNKKILPLISPDGTKRIIYKFEGGALLKYQTQRLNTRSNFPAPTTDSWRSVSAENLPIELITFDVSPLRSPLLAANASDDFGQLQPLVRIRFVSERITIQASYSSRTYGKHALYD